MLVISLMLLPLGIAIVLAMCAVRQSACLLLPASTLRADCKRCLMSQTPREQCEEWFRRQALRWRDRSLTGRGVRRGIRQASPSPAGALPCSRQTRSARSGRRPGGVIN